MPEGDSLFRLADRIRPVLAGRAVTAFEAHAIDDAVAASVVGHVVAEVEARGKNLLVRFDDGRALHIHLRMLGRLGIERPRSAFYAPRAGRPQLRLATSAGAIVGRKIPVVRLLVAGGEARAPELARLGPDLVREGLDEDDAIARLRALGAKPIGEALLVQRAVAGIGNVYKSEVLFLERTDPRAPTSRVDDDHLRRLVRRASFLLRKNLGHGPRTTRASLTGQRLWVYGRDGRACFRCKGPIVRFYEPGPNGRSTYHCPSCQIAPRSGVPDIDERATPGDP